MDQRATTTTIDDQQLKRVRERVLSGFPDDGDDTIVDVLAGVLAGESYSISDLRRIGQPIIAVSDAFSALTGYRRDEALGRDLGFLMRDDTDQDEVRAVREAVRDGRVATALVRCYRRDGSLFWNEQRHYPVKDARGRVAHLVVVQRDVTELVHTRSAQDVAKQLALSLGGDGAFFSYGALLDAAGRCRVSWVNGGVSGVLGASAAALVGCDLSDVVVEDDRPAFAEHVSALRHERGSHRQRYRLRGSDGSLRLVEDFAAVSWVADEADLVAVHGVVRDVTDEQRRRLDLDEVDRLTGLPTERVLEDRLEQALRRVRRHGGAAALVDIELDHFDFVHRSMSKRRGERLLQEAARRLQRALRRSDTLAVVATGRFAVVLPDLTDADAAVAVVDKLLAWVARPFDDGELQVELSASAGVAVAPLDGRRPERLRERAAGARERAHAAGGGRFAFASDALDRAAHDRIAFDHALQRAFRNDELVLHYQPRVQLRDGVTSSVEALVRWQHPERGLLEPSEFLPELFRAGLGDRLFEWSLERAARQAASWREHGCVRRVSVNVSPDLLERRDFAAVVRNALERWQLHPGQLELELHEETGAQALDQGLEQLGAVRRLGVGIALDDFGSVATDLTLLRTLPVDTIKIDRSYVRRVGREAAHADVEMLRALATIGHGLGLGVVAEGIETADQHERVVTLGISEGQGFRFGRAVPPERLPLDSVRVHALADADVRSAARRAD